ncbi:MAG: ABC transporter permease, partial [Candidatus Bipolaricaulota bacterium]
MIHIVRLAASNIRSRRTRSWLTILGVLIGVTAVVALLSIGTGVKTAVLQQFEDIGYDIIVILPRGGVMAERALGTALTERMAGRGTFAGRQEPQASSAGTTQATPGGTFAPSQIGQSPSTSAPVAMPTVDTEALLADVPGLIEAGNLGSRVVNVNGPTASGFLRLTTPSLGFLASFPSILSGFQVAEGTTFTSTEQNQVVLGARGAESLGATVGDRITIGGEAFVVVGILASTRSAGVMEDPGAPAGPAAMGAGDLTRTVGQMGGTASLLTRGFTSTEDSLFVLEERARSVWPTASTNSTTIVRMETGASVDTVMTAITAELSSQGVTATPVSVQEIADSIQGTLGMIETVLASIAAVALLVGGVGLMNTMYTAVLERTREIGILKAVGARDGQVMALFLVDSGLMGLIGGILGLVLGGVLSLFGTRLLGPALGVGSFAPSLSPGLFLGVLAA